MMAAMSAVRILIAALAAAGARFSQSADNHNRQTNNTHGRKKDDEPRNTVNCTLVPAMRKPLIAPWRNACVDGRNNHPAKQQHQPGTHGENDEDISCDAETKLAHGRAQFPLQQRIFFKIVRIVARVAMRHQARIWRHCAPFVEA